MPRDLDLEKKETESMPALEREPIPLTAEPEVQGSDAEEDWTDDDSTDRIQHDTAKESGLLSLKPIRRLLTLDDVDSCVILENAAFDHPEHRCSREKVSVHWCRLISRRIFT